MEKLIILAGSAVINVLFSKGIALGLVLILDQRQAAEI